MKIPPAINKRGGIFIYGNDDENSNKPVVLSYIQQYNTEHVKQDITEKQKSLRP
ncbi:hypothetical protein [Mucilaginibacter celer]|uniref:hypothetical protein n=1 Tax=Mucilaginibacter celer TaxID=2305508 RepID=UPI0013CE700F|nr:hypothetical protein [Mucilaginibacter celer]